MVNRFVESWNNANGIAYGENYWPEAELADPTGTIHTGRVAIQQVHVDLWNSIFKGSVIRGSIRRVVPLDKNFLLVDVDLALTQFNQLPTGGSAPQGVVKRTSSTCSKNATALGASPPRRTRWCLSRPRNERCDAYPRTLHRRMRGRKATTGTCRRAEVDPRLFARYPWSVKAWSVEAVCSR